MQFTKWPDAISLRQSSYVAGNNKLYLCLDVNYSELLSDLNQIWIFLTNFNESLQYQISLKSLHRESI